MNSRYVPVIHGAALDRPDEADTISTAVGVAASLQGLGFESNVISLTANPTALSRLAALQPRLVFNLVEALDGKATGAIDALQRLEALRLPHTGATAATYAASNSKLDTKQRLADHDIPAPAFWTGKSAIPADAVVIVKSVDEHGSLGMDQGSVVRGDEAAAELARRTDLFGTEFYAEAFVDGREFNVSIIETDVGPVVLPLAEIDFSGLPAGHYAIVDFGAKWDPADIGYQATPRRFVNENHEPELAAELRKLSLACWHAFSFTGYARVDFRVDAAGRPFVLEINANPCLAHDAGFAAAADRAGYSYDQMIAAIATAAIQRPRQVA